MKTHPELDAFCKAVAERFGDDAVAVLFGSRARGEAGEWSDYDVLILAEFAPNKQRGVEIARAFKHLQLDLQCLTPDEYRERITAAIEGRPAPPVNGQEASRCDALVALSALEGVCLLGESRFAPFLNLRRDWIDTGKMRDPRLDRHPDLVDGFVPIQRAILKHLPTEKRRKCAAVVGEAHDL